MSKESTPSLAKLLQEKQQLIVNTLTKRIDAMGINASHTLRQSVEITTDVMGNGYVMRLYMEDYWEWVDQGRGPTKKGGTGQVQRNLSGPGGWIAHKGLTDRGGTKKWQRRMSELYQLDRDWETHSQ